jgi:hypothetical protein
VADGLSSYLNGVQEWLHRAEAARAEEAQATAVQERKAGEVADMRNTCHVC